MRVSRYLPLIVVVTVAALYPILLTANIYVYRLFIDTVSSRDYSLVYNITGATTTLNYTVVYRGMLVIRIVDGRASVESLDYNYTITYYLPPEMLNMRKVMSSIVNETVFRRIFLVDNPWVYDLGRGRVEEITRERNMSVGGISLIYRGEDTVKIKELASIPAKMVILRAGYSGNNTPLILLVYKYLGVVVKAEYRSSNGLTSIRAVLRNIDKAPLKDIFVYASIYERIADIDYGKHIILNVMLFFGVIIVWGLIVGEIGEKAPGRRTRYILMASGIGFTTVAIALASGVSGYPMPALYYLFLALFTACIAVVESNRVKDRGLRLALLFSSAAAVILFLYTLVIPWLYIGSLYKIGIESKVIIENETVESPWKLVDRGLDPVIIARENLYYSIEGVNAVLIPLLFLGIPLVAAGIALLRAGRRGDGVLAMVIGAGQLIPSILLTKTQGFEWVIKNRVVDFGYHLTTLGLDIASPIAVVSVAASGIAAFFLVLSIVLERR